jgi:hypothetical protein
VELGEPPLRKALQPGAVVLLIGAAACVAASPHQRRKQRVQLGSARARSEPDILIALAFVERANAEATLQEEAVWTLRDVLQLRDRKRVARGTEIEDRAGLGHIPIERGELIGRARLFGHAAEGHTSERVTDDLNSLVAGADDAA